MKTCICLRLRHLVSQARRSRHRERLARETIRHLGPIYTSTPLGILGACAWHFIGHE